MEEKELFGKLFNNIPLLTEDHLDVLLQTLDREKSIWLLVEAVKHAYHMGVYSMGEVEVISKSIRVISKKENEE